MKNKIFLTIKDEVFTSEGRFFLASIPIRSGSIPPLEAANEPQMNSRSGQALLIVVLTMVIALTVGLSVVSRTVVNLKLSKQSEESQRAFQAAEAGIEQALKLLGQTTTITGQFVEQNSAYETKIITPSGNSLLLANGTDIEQDIGTDVWLSKYPDYTDKVSGDITMYWGTSSQSDCQPNPSGNNPASVPTLEVLILSGSLTSPTFSKELIDPCTAVNNRTPGAGSPDAGGGGTIEGVTFSYKRRLAIANSLIMKAIPVYNSSKIAVVFVPTPPSPSLPTQGSLVVSTGTSGETAKKVEYFQSFPQIPVEVFPYSILSQ